jgi:hypothetical protein
MPDPDTRRAINETLRNVRSRLNDQFEKVRRGRRGDETEAPIRSERMATYTRAMKIVSQFIRPVAETDYPDE